MSKSETYHVNGDFANFGGTKLLAEVFDAFLLLGDFFGEYGLQVGAVGCISHVGGDHRQEVLWKEAFEKKGG